MPRAPSSNNPSKREDRAALENDEVSSVARKARQWLNEAFRQARAEGELVVDLNRMTPTRKNLKQYLKRVSKLLHHSIDQVLDTKKLGQEFRTLYRDLVLATAWQETCWRQYILKNDALVTITSSAGALGMMQIMPRVWRGFYDTEALENSIAYNALAGSEILHRYLTRYAIRKSEHRAPGGMENLAKASYAAYNGGPRHLSRYRKSTTSSSLKTIDKKFWAKYQKIRQGNELAISACYGVDLEAA